MIWIRDRYPAEMGGPITAKIGGSFRVKDDTSRAAYRGLGGTSVNHPGMRWAGPCIGIWPPSVSSGAGMNTTCGRYGRSVSLIFLSHCYPLIRATPTFPGSRPVLNFSEGEVDKSGLD